MNLIELTEEIILSLNNTTQTIKIQFEDNNNQQLSNHDIRNRQGKTL